MEKQQAPYQYVYTGKFFESIMNAENVYLIDALLSRILEKGRAKGFRCDLKELMRVLAAQGCPVSEKFIGTILRRAGKYEEYMKTGVYRERVYPCSIEVITSLIRGYGLRYEDFFVL